MASILQSSYGTPANPGNFEVVVLDGNNLVHYFRDNTTGGKQSWNRTTIVSSKATGPGTLIQSSYGTPQSPGNLEVVVLEGNNLVHYWRDDSVQGQQKWTRQAVISTKATGPGSVIQSSYGTQVGPGNFEVVVVEGKNLVHYWRNDSPNGKQAWTQGAVVPLN